MLDRVPPRFGVKTQSDTFGRGHLTARIATPLLGLLLVLSLGAPPSRGAITLEPPSAECRGVGPRMRCGEGPRGIPLVTHRAARISNDSMTRLRSSGGL